MSDRLPPSPRRPGGGVMGWREAWERAERSVSERGSFVGIPPADRIALAQELLAGTGRVVCVKTERCLSITNDRRARDYASGFNACRLAMMEGKDD